MIMEEVKLRGNQYFKEEKYQSALDAYIEAMKMNPSDYTLYSNSAACCLKLNKNEEAVEYAGECIRLAPHFSKGYFRKGMAYKNLGMHQEAIFDFKKSLETTPGDQLVLDQLAECEKHIRLLKFSAAIRVNNFDLKAEKINGIEVDSIYEGPKYDIDQKLTIKEINGIISFYGNEKKLHKKYLYKVMLDAKSAIEKEENIHKVKVPKEGFLTICGDVHGQFFDVCKIFEINGLPSEKHYYIFNGDFVDRGAHSIEVISTLLHLKAAFPEYIFLTRGNHESPSVNRTNSFYTECISKYGNETYDMFSKVFNCLPIGFIVQDSFFVVHGGIPSAKITIEKLNALDRFKVPENGSLISQILWSDPGDQPGLKESPRGEGVLFGADITECFLKLNNLQKVIRSHVWECEGYKETHNGKCITIFSAPNYTGVPSPAAFIKINSHLELSFQQFEAAAYQGRAEKPKPSIPQYF